MSTGTESAALVGEGTPPPRQGPAGTAHQLPSARSRVGWQERADRRTSLLLILPALALMGVFIVWPIFESLRLSFADWDGLTEPEWIGVGNYLKLFADPLFYLALRNNLIFAVVATVGTVGVGTIFALAIDARVPGWRVYRFVYFLPMVLPGTILALMWAGAFDPNFGWLSFFLEPVLPQAATGLLANPDTALWVICFTALWGGIGFPMVLVLGGLQNIPKEVKEAAILDGAGPMQRALRISVPLCKDVIATVLLLQLIGAFKVFDVVVALTGGGPGNATQVLGTLIYRQAFQQGQFGYGSAIAVVASAIIIVISLLYLTVLRPGRIEKAG